MATADGPAAGTGRAAVIRAVAMAGIAALSLVTGAAVARRLGPEGKGVVSLLSYLVALLAPTATIGLGEAGVIRMRRAKADPGLVVARTVPAVAAAGVLGGIVLAAGAVALLGNRAGELRTGIVATAFAVPLAAVTHAGCLLLDGQYRLVLTSVIRLGTALATAVATVALILPFWTTGALTAAAVGWAAAAVATFAALRPRLRLPGAAGRQGAMHYLSGALRMGAPVQLAQLLVILSARADLLAVEVLADPRAVGYYSVALTVAGLVPYGASALAASAFPALAAAHDDKVLAHTVRATRIGTAAAVLSAAAVALLAPVVVPLAFGRGFTGAIASTLLLLPGTVLYSAQLVLTRARAARGDGRALVASFGSSLAVMVALDLALVPLVGEEGAAIAYSLSAAVGLAVVLRAHRRRFGPTARPSVFLPRRTDLAEVVRAPWVMARRRR